MVLLTERAARTATKNAHKSHVRIGCVKRSCATLALAHGVRLLYIADRHAPMKNGMRRELSSKLSKPLLGVQGVGFGVWRNKKYTLNCV